MFVFHSKPPKLSKIVSANIIAQIAIIALAFELTYSLPADINNNNNKILGEVISPRSQKHQQHSKSNNSNHELQAKSSHVSTNNASQKNESKTNTTRTSKAKSKDLSDVDIDRILGQNPNLVKFFNSVGTPLDPDQLTVRTHDDSLINSGDRDFTNYEPLCQVESGLKYAKYLEANLRTPDSIIPVTSNFKQLIHVERCLTPNQECALHGSLPDYKSSVCKQKTRIQKILILNTLTNKEDVEYMNVESCCVCMIRDRPLGEQFSSRIANITKFPPPQLLPPKDSFDNSAKSSGETLPDIEQIDRAPTRQPKANSQHKKEVRNEEHFIEKNDETIITNDKPLRSAETTTQPRNETIIVED